MYGETVKNVFISSVRLTSIDINKYRY